MLIKFKFDDDHAASQSFIDLFKSIKLPDYHENEIQNMMKKYKKKVNKREMQAGFFEQLGIRTEHLKNNKMGKFSSFKYFCQKSVLANLG